MKLNEYIIKSRMMPKDFAEISGIGISSIYRYIRGEVPRLKSAEKIEKASNGKVTVEEQLKSKM